MRHLIILLSCLLLFGCATPKISTSQVKEEVTTIKSAANDIDMFTNNEPIIRERTDVIRESADIINNQVTQLSTDHTKTLEKLQKDNKKLENDLKSEKDKNNALLKKGLYGIITLATIALGVCVALTILGNAKLITGAIIAGTIILSALTVLTAITYVIYVSIGFGVLLACGIVYYALVYRKANKQIISNIDQGLKTGAINADKFTAIANDAKKGQSKSTKVIVDKNQGKKIKGVWGLIK